jgi:hypothetical protein
MRCSEPGHRAVVAIHVDLISDALPFGRLWYAEPNAIGDAIGYAKFRSRSHQAVIRVYDEAGNVIETDEQAGDSSGGETPLNSGLLSSSIAIEVIPSPISQPP